MPTARINGHRGTRDSEDEIPATASRNTLSIERGIPAARRLPWDDAA
jgi:hypothetical protein